MQFILRIVEGTNTNMEYEGFGFRMQDKDFFLLLMGRHITDWSVIKSQSLWLVMN